MKKHHTIIYLTLSLVLIFSIGTPLLTALPQERNRQDYGVLSSLQYHPKEHDFLSMLEGETAQTMFNIWRGGGCCSLSYSLAPQEDWITVFPTSGVSYGEQDPITVTVDTTGLEPGRYTGEVKIQSNCGNGVFTVYVSVVEFDVPTLAFEPESYDFGKIPPGIVDHTTFEIYNNGLGTLSYSITEDCPWAQVSPPSGTSQGEHDDIQVQITTVDLAYGQYQCEVLIESNGGNGSFNLTFIVEPIPELEIKIRGGLGIRVTISNVGDTSVSDMQWRITLTDGLITIPEDRQENGTIPQLDPGDSETIKMTIFGFGTIQIHFEADREEESKPGFVFLPFVITR